MIEELTRRDGLRPAVDEEYESKKIVGGAFYPDLRHMKGYLEEQGIDAEYNWRPLSMSHLTIEGDRLDVVCYTAQATVYFEDDPREVARSKMVWHDVEEMEFSDHDEEIYEHVVRSYTGRQL